MPSSSSTTLKTSSKFSESSSTSTKNWLRTAFKLVANKGRLPSDSGMGSTSTERLASTTTSSPSFNKSWVTVFQPFTYIPQSPTSTTIRQGATSEWLHVDHETYAERKARLKKMLKEDQKIGSDLSQLGM